MGFQPRAFTVPPDVCVCVISILSLLLLHQIPSYKQEVDKSLLPYPQILHLIRAENESYPNLNIFSHYPPPFPFFIQPIGIVLYAPSNRNRKVIPVLLQRQTSADIVCSSFPSVLLPFPAFRKRAQPLLPRYLRGDSGKPPFTVLPFGMTTRTGDPIFLSR